MRLALLCLLLSACAPGPDTTPPRLPQELRDLCDLDPVIVSVWRACGITINETSAGILIAAQDFTLPSFSGLRGSAQGSCTLLTNGEASRGSAGDANYCVVVVSESKVTGIADNTGWVLGGAE